MKNKIVLVTGGSKGYGAMAATAVAAGALLLGFTGCTSNKCSDTIARDDAASGNPISLSVAGKTDYVIVTGSSPIPAEQTAAAELAKFLKKVTGAEFKIVSETTEQKPTKGIYVGWTRFAAAQGIDTARFASEEWSLSTVGGNLVMTGGRPRGTLSAVYQFLEDSVGVHLLDPRTEIVPARADLTVKVPTRTGKPAFLSHLVFTPPTLLMKHWWKERDGGRYFAQFNGNDDYVAGLAEFGTVTKIGSPGHAHTFGSYLSPDEYGKSHPKYFAMHKKADGSLFRNTDDKGTKFCWFDLCLSNPEVRKIFKEKLRGYINADREKAKVQNLPPPFIYCVDQNDCLPGYGCLCPECRAIVEREGAESGLLIDFINEIADSVKADYPDILVQTFAYNHTLKAPKTIRPRDNVMIRWCDNYGTSEFFRPLTHEYNRNMRELLEPWSKISKNLAVWDYWRRFVEHTQGFYVPAVNIHCLKPDLAYYQANGVKSLFAECEDWHGSAHGFSDDFHSFNPLRVWLGMKLMAEPTRDEKPLMDIFFNGYYGAAAAKMRELLAYIEKRQDECGRKLNPLPREDYCQAYLDLTFFLTARKLLEEAEAACGSDTLSRAHVARERIPVDSALLHLEPSLRKTFCASGESYPFDRAKVLAEYTAAWDLFLRVYAADEVRAQLKTYVDKCLDYLRSMPMVTAENIRHRADSVADGEIRIDGVLDENAWAGTAKLFLTPMDKTQELKVKTAVRALWSQEKLHVAFECLEDRPREMKFQPREKNDTEICLDSSVEIFLNPSGDRGTYFQILVNPAGSFVNNAVTTLEGKKAFDTSWVSGADVAVKINPDSWVVEMSIPFKSMNFAGKENASIVANFCRSRHLKADETAAQLQTWSPLLVRGFHDPDKFGTITLAGKSDGVLYGSFEGPRDTPSFSSLGSISLACSTDKASEGTTSLRLEFPKGKNHDCVGVKFGHFPVAGDDWPAFSAIKADLYLEGTEPQKLGVRLDANTKTGFAWGAAQLQPGWNKDVALVDLSAIDWSKAGQTTPPSRVESLLLYTYTDAVAGSGVVFLDNLRFIRRQE